MLSLFDQFTSPVLLTMPLVIIALVVPWTLYPAPSTRWQESRALSLLSLVFMSLTKQIMTPINLEGRKWTMMLLSLLIFLTTLNMAGTLPYTFTPTTQLCLSLGLAFPLWLATIIIGFRLYPLRTVAHLVPESTPAALIPALILIETISLLVRPLALGVRLAANLTAGHMILQMIASTAFNLVCTLNLTGILVTLILYSLTLLELMVAAIQAYVFVLLLSLYLQENI